MKKYTAALLVVFFSISTAAQAQNAYMAVLPIKIKTQTVNRAAADFLTDEVRIRAHEILGRQFNILTQENILQIMKAQGRKPNDCEGECETELGRELGADIVVTGAIDSFSKKLFVTLKAFRTQDGILLATARETAARRDDLLDAVGSAARQLFSQLKEEPAPPAAAPEVKAPAPQSAPAGTMADTGAPATIKVSTEPAYAMVFLDGVNVGGSPITLYDLKPGKHLVRTQGPGLATKEIKINVGPGDVQELKIAMETDATAQGRPDENLTQSPYVEPPPGWTMPIIFYSVGTALLLVGVPYAVATDRKAVEAIDEGDLDAYDSAVNRNMFSWLLLLGGLSMYIAGTHFTVKNLKAGGGEQAAKRDTGTDSKAGFLQPLKFTGTGFSYGW